MRLTLGSIARVPLKLLRLSAYLACVFFVFSALAARSLYAQAKEAARALGREIADLPELTRDADVVLLNGARMHHARTSTRDGVRAVLDRIEAHCDKNPGPMAQALAELRLQHPEAFESGAARHFRGAVMREESDEDGVVICFTGDRHSGLAGFARALTRVAETSDLSELGYVHYAFAERQKDGSTRVVFLWTDGELNLERMFPATGDAEGTDSRVLPRPPAARRTLSASAEGMPYALRIYESGEQSAALQKFYDVRMKGRGFARAAHAQAEGTTAYLGPEGAQAFVTLFEDEGKTSVTLTESSQSIATSIATVEHVE